MTDADMTDADKVDEEAGDRLAGGAAERWAARLLELLGGAALVALAVLTVSDALLRSFANRPIRGANDMIQVLLVLVVAAAIPLCIHAGRAIAIDIITRRLPQGARRIVARLVNLICALVLALLAWRCAVNAREAALFGETTMLLQIPFGPFYWCLTVSFAVSALLFAVLTLCPGRYR